MHKKLNTTPKLRILLLISACVLLPLSAIAQTISISNIDDEPNNSVGTQNCTSTKQACSTSQSLDCWEWEYDTNANGGGETCTDSEFNTIITKDGQSREFDVGWNTSYNTVGGGGALFHATLGASNLYPHNTLFNYDTWVYFGDLTYVTAAEFDLNQVLNVGNDNCQGEGEDCDTVVYGTECVIGGNWEVASYDSSGNSHWNTTDQACELNTSDNGEWEHLIITYQRESDSNCSPGYCLVTYDTVSFAGTQHNFTCAGGGAGSCQYSSSFTPPSPWCDPALGCLITNFQIDWASSNATGNITAYADEMAVTLLSP
jgi:hypothetical protein